MSFVNFCVNIREFPIVNRVRWYLINKESAVIVNCELHYTIAPLFTNKCTHNSIFFLTLPNLV